MMQDYSGAKSGAAAGYGYIPMSEVAETVDRISVGNNAQWVIDFQEKWKRDKISWSKVIDRRKR